SGNSVSDGGGGGIANFSSGMLTVTNSTVSGNYSTSDKGDAGGILNSLSTLTVTNSTVSSNRGDFGGGIYNYHGTLTVTNSSVSSNIGYNGGGIYNPFGTLTVTNSTISGNMGGGIVDSGGTLHARNTIIAGNTDPFDPDLYGNLGSLGHNHNGNTQGGSGFDDTDLLNVNPLLGPLQDNGGPTFTMALLPGSPAIDAGDNTDAPDWDQRGPGFPRIVGIIDPDNPIMDIGAFEVQQDGGDRSGRPVRPAAKPIHIEVAAFIGIQPLQHPVS